MINSYTVQCAYNYIFSSKNGYVSLKSPINVLESYAVRTIYAVRNSSLIKNHSIISPLNRKKSPPFDELFDIQKELKCRSVFYDYNIWICYWALSLSVQNLINTVSLVDGAETAHNGAIIGLLTVNTWWFSLAAISVSAKKIIHFTALTLERRSDLYASDFAFITPAGSDHRGALAKIIFIQAKRREKHGDVISLNQAYGSSGRSQLRELVRIDSILLKASGRAVAKPNKLLFDSICYYVCWDRLSSGKVATTPAIKSARAIRRSRIMRIVRSRRSRIKITKKSREENNIFEDSCDMATLISLWFMDISSNVGVVMPVTDMAKIFLELKVPTKSMVFIGSHDPEDHIKREIMKVLIRLGFKGTNYDDEDKY